jgi:phage gp36-like protein
MNYLMQSDLLAVMSQQDLIDLTDDYRVGAVSDEVLNAAERAAVSDLELYAAKYYTLPLPSVESVKALVMQLMKYHLYARRRVVPEEVQSAYKLTMRKLEQLGPSSLGIPGVEPEAGSSAGISVSAPCRRFDNNFQGVEY